MPGFWDSILGNFNSGSQMGPSVGLANPQNLYDVGNVQGLQDYNSINGFGQQGGFGTGLSGVGNIMGGLSGLAGAYVGYKQLGLAEDQFDFTKDITNRNLFNQAQITNATMRDRQNARIGSAGTANAPYQASNKYMARNQVSGSPV